MAALTPERMARWEWRQPHGEGKERAPELWADLGDWCREVAEELARLAESGPAAPID